MGVHATLFLSSDSNLCFLFPTLRPPLAGWMHRGAGVCFCGSEDPLASLGQWERNRAWLRGRFGQYPGGFSIRPQQPGPETVTLLGPLDSVLI